MIEHAVCVCVPKYADTIDMILTLRLDLIQYIAIYAPEGSIQSSRELNLWLKRVIKYNILIFSLEKLIELFNTEQTRNISIEFNVFKIKFFFSN